MIITPIKFHGHVIRKLSDWCNVVPDISIDAELPSLDIQLGPGDYSAILSVVNSLSDGRPTAPPADMEVGDDGREKGVTEEKGSNSKELEMLSDTKSDVRSHVQLSVKFHMQKVPFRIFPSTFVSCSYILGNYSFE